MAIAKNHKIAEYYCKRLEELKKNRTILETRWQTVAEFFFPERADITIEHAQGEVKNNPLEVVRSKGIKAKDD